MISFARAIASDQAAISFMYALPRPEVLTRLTQRAATLDEVIAHADAALADAAQTVAAISHSEEHYAQHMRTAERDWIVQFTQTMRSGKLAWPRPRRASSDLV